MVLKQDRARAEEIRLRLGEPADLLPDGEFPISEEPGFQRDLEMVLDITQHRRPPIPSGRACGRDLLR